MSTVFFDIDTQIDFLFASGALYVPGAERRIPAIGRLNHYAEKRGIPVVSSTDAHAEDDPEFQQWQAHCVAGTFGQLKPAGTLLARRVVLPNCPIDVDVEGAQQILLEKNKLDLFTNPNIGQLLERLKAERYVVYGVVTELCVKCASMGLLATGRPVSLVTDAIETLNPERSDAMIREFSSKGGHLTTVSEVCSQ